MAFLEFRNLTKSFPGVRALRDVSFGVEAGSVHALCGENGAGKSTLLKILSGVQPADSGSIGLNGKEFHFGSPQQAIDEGVAVIYQELHLVPYMSVAENVFLGHPPSKGAWLNKTKLLEDTRQILKDLGEAIDPRQIVADLSIAQRQMVEIAKALSREAKVFAFDEPTSSLSTREVTRLFDLIAKLKSEGKAILFVSHRMDEIFRICDTGTVLRDGAHVETFPTLEGIDAGIFVNRMVGRPIDDVFGYRPREIAAPILEVKGLAGPGLREPASFGVGSGEIVGIFGLVGAGRSELLKAIFGDTASSNGKVKVGGKPLKIKHPADAIVGGIMLCPEDRKKEGIVPLRSVQDNINLGVRRRFSPGGFLIAGAKERENAQDKVDRMHIKTPSLGQTISLLSGGNQQKAILGRSISENVKVLLLDEPTRGIDIGAKREIYDIIYGLAESGIGVVFVSSELPEVLGVCDHIMVMRQGRLVGDIPRSEATQESLLKLALPVAEEIAS
jgi:L-arabinose transport system ATP-binding protein